MADFKADEVKLREKLYRSMIGQLLNDGFMGVAKSLTSQVKPQASCVPSDNLFKAYSIGVDQVMHFYIAQVLWSKSFVFTFEGMQRLFFARLSGIKRREVTITSTMLLQEVGSILSLKVKCK